MLKPIRADFEYVTTSNYLEQGDKWDTIQARTMTGQLIKPRS